MAQEAAYTEHQIIAAGMAIRARGLEPTRPLLFNELGRCGQANTAWKTWVAYRDRLDQTDAPDDMRPEDEPVSPELTEAYRAHRNTLTALTERVRAEEREPRDKKIAALQDALGRAYADNGDLEDLVDAQQQVIAEQSQQIERLLAERGAGMPRLILPGQSWPPT